MDTSEGLTRNRNWRLLWTGQAVSELGDAVFGMTVVLWIATIIARGQTWAPAAAGGALIAMAAPVLVVGPLAGVYVDRWNRQRTMLVADAARCVLISLLLIVPVLQGHVPAIVQLAILYVVMAACTCFKEFFDPSRLAILGAIVPPQDQPNAAGQLVAAQGAAQLIGPPLAAPVLFVLGVQWALVIDALSFAFSFACVRAIKAPEEQTAPRPEQGSFWTEFRAGLRFFAGSRVLVALAVGAVIATMGAGALQTLVVFFVPHNLHVTAKWLGLIAGGLGVGGITGGLLTGALARRIPPTRLFWLGLILTGIAFAGFARTTTLPWAIAAAILVGFFLGVLNSVLEPILLGATPTRMLGRVVAVFGPLMQFAQITSVLLAGVLASTVLRNFKATIAGVRFGPYDTIMVIGGLLFVVAGLASIIPLHTPAPAANPAENPAAGDPIAAGDPAAAEEPAAASDD